MNQTSSISNNQEKLPFSQWNPLIAENFVKEWEGLKLKAYKCSANTLTIGHGHTKNVKPGQVITKQQAEKYLKDDLIEHAEALSKYVTCKLTEGQYIALLDLAFNVGVGAVAKSKTLELLNAGKIEEAKKGFLSFAKQKMKDKNGNILRDEHGRIMYEVINGLMNRRKAEVALM